MEKRKEKMIKHVTLDRQCSVALNRSQEGWWPHFGSMVLVLPGCWTEIHVLPFSKHTKYCAWHKRGSTFDLC